jgi:Na+/proline symporter
MSGIDWTVLLLTLFINQRNLDHYLLDSNSAKWWTVGLSVMATQASAITFLSTPGQAFDDGMGFVQFYFGLPVAIVIICITFIPIYNRLKVFTAYEYLEKRFDLKTRVLTASLFLFQRGMAAGITIYAPAIVLSTVLGLDLNIMIWAIGGLVIVYTVSGGTRAVSVTHKYQMFVIFIGLFIAFFIVLNSLPGHIGFTDALRIAGASDKMNILDFNFDWNSRYTFWSGLIAGTFLQLSYFGTDQSQVQRYLTGSSVRESRLGLLFNAAFKVPMQFFILLVGIMVFVFYQYNSSPIFFNDQVRQEVYSSEVGSQFRVLEGRLEEMSEEKKSMYDAFISDGQTDELRDRIGILMTEERGLRRQAKSLISDAFPDTETNDRDYVFIYFILNNLPVGLIGLLLAVFFCAAMSSTASELNSLASTSLVDFYRRMIRRDGDDAHYVKAARLMTVTWGLVAIGFASVASLFENLIQFVNIIGSLFYGTILGVFIAAFYFKKIRAHSVFIAALITEAVVVAVYFMDVIAYLWLNVLGCLLVVLLGFLLNQMIPENEKTQAE